ncbi:glycosyltransferase [Leucobacter sp. UT-8R-CII-1-4]|uniref:glycosyltransferase n=1 Tax=Leucobacter sp. UT-8R-CII-1-4 TaxID=3040075 RepID=UPI0024A9176B|nr:glycosyltransferase [Leucobacter sp. UT-8R-CII-1-4]MDI6023776.1 glycosyltransferase [Leucobacter sp. UT-8R-CII-1-4]
MRTRVTAILVARHGGEWLDQTLAGIAAQTRQPERVIAVVNGGRESIAQQLRSVAGISGVVSTQAITSFGAAVQQGIAAVPSDRAETTHSQFTAGAAEQPQTEPFQDWFWLLTEDSAPEPRALEEILSTVQRAPSVAVAGPKLVDWDHPDRIIELGQSLTQRGDRWLLRRQERDQQQYDHLQDVLGVGPVGMLVRADVWRQLEGFDPAYAVYDDGLDLSVRARLAGYRVVVAPTSRVRFAQLGVAGPRIERSKRVLRAAHREARTSQLHRRISYAPALAAFFMWLGLPLVAIARVCWALIREQPGNMWAEFSSALRVFFTPGSLTASRRRVRGASTAGWSAVRPLRVDSKTVRTARMIDREAILASQGRMREELHFISTGGLAVLLASVLAAIGLTWWALTKTSLAGGALAPLNSIGELWANTRIFDGVAADPFSWVLALLGSLTFWNPSHAIVLMLVAAIPLAALGGWIWAAQLTKNAAGRALLSFAWAFSPVLLGSLAGGRLPTLILAVVLPWLLLAATRARTSWSWAGTASLLAAIVLACAPVLLPAAIVLLVVGIISSPRGTARVLTVAIAPLALFAPKLLMLLRGANPIDLLLDPGIVSPFTPGNTWHLLLGFPEFGLEGWGAIFEQIGLGNFPVTLLVGVLLLPIVLLAAIGLLTGRVPFTVLHAVLGGLGLLTAVVSAKLQLMVVGGEAVSIWTGSGIALYWIAVLGLASVGTTVLRKAAAPVVAVSLVLALTSVAPVAVKLATAQTGMVSGEAQMPALVLAAGTQDPDLRTLVITVEGKREVRAQIVTGAGLHLDEMRTGAISESLTVEDSKLAEVVGALASTGDEDRTASLLAAEDIGFVLLENAGDATERSQLQSAFDQQTALENAGQTSHGLLWRAADTSANTAVADEHVASGPWLVGMSYKVFTQLIWWIQVVVLGAMILLALPTGEVVEEPQRRRKRKNGKTGPDEVLAKTDETAPAGAEQSAASVEPAVVEPATADPATETTAPVEPSADEPQRVDPASEHNADANEISQAIEDRETTEAQEPAEPAEPAESAEPAGPAGPAEPAAAAEKHPQRKIPKFLRPADDEASEGGER